MISEAAKVIGLYERQATNWDKDRERCLFEKPWLDRFLSLVPARASILDIGCGSGEPIARFFIEQGHEVTGADSSASLIDLCKSRFPMQRWIVADMRELHLDERFDGVMAWDSFFHLCPEDQRQMFPLFRKHSAPNAALLFTSGTSHGEAIGEYRGEPLYHGSLDTREYSKLLHENEFEIVSHVERDVACGLRTVWLAHVR
jgi:cyclopropane fatty-acyl-phospholipid synthase-like methyltransferase